MKQKTFEGISTCLQCGRPRFDPWVEKMPWGRKWQPTPVFLPENPMNGGAWQATVHEIAKSQTQPSNFTSFFQFSSSIITIGNKTLLYFMKWNYIMI